MLKLLRNTRRKERLMALLCIVLVAVPVNYTHLRAHETGTNIE